MPTYLFDRVEPVQDIIEADGKFGADQMYQAVFLYEMLNVFGGTEWALYLSGTLAQTDVSMTKNPFVAEFGLVWARDESHETVALGTVAKISISRQVAHTILMAKFGATEHTESYINEAEHQDGFAYWSDNFADEEGFDRLALIDDFEAWAAALEVAPGS